MKRILIVREAGDQNGRIFGFSLNGTALTATRSVTYRSSNTKQQALVDYPPSKRVHVYYRDGGYSERLRVNPIEVADYSSNLTSDNYCGIADADYADGATATIQTVGAVDDAQSGLTPGETYYLQDDGTLGTSAGNQGSRAIAGLALSSTNLLIYKA